MDKQKRFVVGPLDGPYSDNDPAYPSSDEAMAPNRQATVHDVTMGCWDRGDFNALVGLRWQGNWYKVTHG